MQVLLCDTHGLAWETIEKLASTLPPRRRAAFDAAASKEAKIACAIGFCLVRYAIRHATGVENAPVGDFEVGENGKPAPIQGVHFNLSHTAGLVAVALCAHHPVGVDVERVRAHPARFAARWFSKEEQAALAAAPDPDAALAALWSAKEAVGKERGTGLDGGIAAIDTARAATSLLTVSGERYALSLSPATALPDPKFVPVEALI